MKIGEVRKMLAIELPEEVDTRLEQLVKETGRTKSDHVLEAILEYLDDLEDLRIAEARLEDIRAGHSRTIPLDEVMREYGMED
jgi:RHH-type transcriptional regulator, rel operon repressor / antitoxin RelB